VPRCALAFLALLALRAYSLSSRQACSLCRARFLSLPRARHLTFFGSNSYTVDISLAPLHTSLGLRERHTQRDRENAHVCSSDMSFFFFFLRRPARASDKSGRGGCHALQGRYNCGAHQRGRATAGATTVGPTGHSLRLALLLQVLSSVYLLYWYKGTNTDLKSCVPGTGAQFTCFTSTTVQILTCEEVRAGKERWTPKSNVYFYKNVRSLLLSFRTCALASRNASCPARPSVCLEECSRTLSGERQRQRASQGRDIDSDRERERERESKT
jgi:hypothetical protein